MKNIQPPKCSTRGWQCSLMKVTGTETSLDVTSHQKTNRTLTFTLLMATRLNSVRLDISIALASYLSLKELSHQSPNSASHPQKSEISTIFSSVTITWLSSATKNSRKSFQKRASNLQPTVATLVSRSLAHLSTFKRSHRRITRISVQVSAARTGVTSRMTSS